MSCEVDAIEDLVVSGMRPLAFDSRELLNGGVT
jgi:hypothetical protein